MTQTKWCMDDKHGTPCRLPCEGCAADECDGQFARTFAEMDEPERAWMRREVKMGNIPADAVSECAARDGSR